MVAMYRLGGDPTGPTVRIDHLRDSLAHRVRLDVVSGARLKRAGALVRYVARGRMRGLAGIYVESSSSLPGPIDFVFLGLARLSRIKVLTFIRDAYQLFPEYYSADSVKRRISRAVFLPAFRSLAWVSSNVAFPSRGLARAVLGDARSRLVPLLPPGAQVSQVTPVDPKARAVLYVGSLAHAAHGGAILVEAVRLTRERGLDVELICVTPARDEPAGPHPAWLRFVRASGAQIEQLLPDVLATVTPRRRTPYNELAVPIKLLEYLGYGRPLIVTDVEETAAIVRGADCGVVVSDTAEGLAAGIAEVLLASADRIQSWGEAARRAAAANSWEVRANRILELLGVVA
jgi:glycosyltransferase involved in cell wall biosynthesis